MASPTVQLEILMISLLIDTHEGRDVAAADVVGSYLLEDMEDYVLVKLIGDVVNIMCEINNRFIPFVVMEMIKKYYI